MNEKQSPQQGNISIPLEGAKTGFLKPVRLNPNLQGYKGGKLADLPMYGKVSDIDPVVVLTKKTVINARSRL